MTAVDAVPRRRDIELAVESAFIFLIWMVGALLLSMLAWAVVPTLLFGWDPMVVTSGSMSPLIDTGDVVLIDPDHGQPGKGSVVAFDLGDGPVVHRVIRANADGSLTTRGDANQADDSSLVRNADLMGTGRLLVPFIGMVRVVGWGWLVAVIGLTSIAYLMWRTRPWLSAAVVLLAMAVGTVGVVGAAFASTTASGDNSFSAVDAAPPTNVIASCGLVGVDNLEVAITWAHSTTTQRTGYEIFHDDPTAGDTWISVGTTGPTATGFTHSITPPLLSVGSHQFMVRTRVGPWNSEDSNVDPVTITFAIAWVCTS